VTSSDQQWDADTLVWVIGEAIKRMDFPAIEAGIRALAAVDEATS
jgi:hypothetical protein